MATLQQVQDAYKSIGRTNIDQEGLDHWLKQDAANLNQTFAAIAKDKTSAASANAALIDPGFAKSASGVTFDAAKNGFVPATIKSAADVGGVAAIDSPQIETWANDGLLGKSAQVTPPVIGKVSPTVTPPPTEIAKVAPVTPSTPGIATSAVATATPYSVDKRNELLENRIPKLISGDSEMNQVARAGALAAGNARGLLNSSMTEGASVDALIKNAIAIAQPDAARYATVADTNNKNTNTFALDQAGRDTSVSQSNASNTTQTSIANMGETGTNARFDVNWENDFTKGSVQQGYAERTAAQANTYQVARDSVLNNYTVARDRALAGDVTERDTALAAATTARDTALAAITTARDTAAVNAAKTTAADLAKVQADLQTSAAANAATAAANLVTANANSASAAATVAANAAELIATAKTAEARTTAETNLKSLLQENLAKLISEANTSIINIKGNKDLLDATKMAMIHQIVTAATAQQTVYKNQLVAINFTPDGGYFDFGVWDPTLKTSATPTPGTYGNVPT